MSDTPDNTFLHGRLGAIYLKTALPIIFVMGMNGLLAVADALFLGHYVGPDALAAVTLMFPLYMVIVSLATLVSSGMSSLLARHLGAQNTAAAQGVFTGAHGLAMMMSLVLMLLFITFGPLVATLTAGGSATLADLGLIYLRITVFFTPLFFILAVNSDALRNEGRVGFMAAMSLLTSIGNIGFNYILIVLLDMGVAGSAYGTALAQFLALSIILGFRIRGKTALRPSAMLENRWTTSWGRILALGAPQSLGFMGLALGSAAIVAALQMVNAPHYDSTITAYGIITRIITFTFLPLLGLGHAMQTITGNNYGAGAFARSDQSLRIAIRVSFAYCATIQIIFTLAAPHLGRAFVDDPVVIAEVGRILPIMAVTFFAAGPLMMIATHFQATGDAMRASILGLSKPYLFAIPLTFILALQMGEIGIWIAGPVAEILLGVLTIIILSQRARRTARHLGLFSTRKEVTP